MVKLAGAAKSDASGAAKSEVSGAAKTEVCAFVDDHTRTVHVYAVSDLRGRVRVRG